MKLEGEAVKLGDDINTDVILPGKYLTLTDYHKLGDHALEGLISNFIEKAKHGVIIVAGENFGCGSSREHAPIALKYAGVQCIVAKSFARIFFRNSINIGLPIVECKEAYSNVENGDQLTIDLKNGIIKDLRNEFEMKFHALPKFMLEILDYGGLIPYLKERVKQS
jgi:3-isopropylmalate/(R)-2-methylmalate dehydratase small subunit